MESLHIVKYFKKFTNCIINLRTSKLSKFENIVRHLLLFSGFQRTYMDANELGQNKPLFEIKPFQNGIAK